MEFEGVVYKILPLTQGTSARGEWQRQDVVFELPSEFSRKICVTFFNKPSDVAKLREGATYTVSVNVESREYNGRWYTDVRAWIPAELAYGRQARGKYILPNSALKFEVELEDVIPFVEETTPATTDEAAAATTQAANSALPVKK